jgi:hypothetical protein
MRELGNLPQVDWPLVVVHVVFKNHGMLKISNRPLTCRRETKRYKFSLLFYTSFDDIPECHSVQYQLSGNDRLHHSADSSHHNFENHGCRAHGKSMEITYEGLIYTESK